MEIHVDNILPAKVKHYLCKSRVKAYSFILTTLTKDADQSTATINV